MHDQYHIMMSALATKSYLRSQHVQGKQPSRVVRFEDDMVIMTSKENTAPSAKKKEKPFLLTRNKGENVCNINSVKVLNDTN